MNILLWVVQAVLAFLYLAGGGFKIGNPDDVAKQARTFARGAWRFIGALEVVGAILLIVPLAAGWMPVLTPIAAAVLALETFFLAAVYARVSTKLVASNPLVYAVPMGVLALLVALGRFTV